MVSDGSYNYIARYVDDVMCFSKNPQAIIDHVSQSYTMKGVGYPQFYLGGDVVELPPSSRSHNISSYSLFAHTYINNCLVNLERMCQTTFKPSSVPFSISYHAVLDQSAFCSPLDMTHYRSFLWSANWMITLGRFDIAYAVNTLAQYCCVPRLGHLHALQHIFGYLKLHPHGMLLVDTSLPPGWNHAVFQKDCDWAEFFPDALEDIPSGCPPAFGDPLHITTYVDADHAWDNVTSRFVTDILLLVNNTPIAWLSKRLRTVETSPFGS